MKNFRQTWQEIKKGWKSGSPDCDVEDVASDRGGDCHVTEALPGDDDGGDQVGDGGARGEEGQPHHLQTLVSFCINTHGDNSYPWLATIILLLKRLDMTWCVLLRAVETNWEISSQSLAIRYTTGFKPFYFHGKDRITTFYKLSSFESKCSPPGEFQWCCPWRWPTRPSSRSRARSRWSIQRKWWGRTFALQEGKCQIKEFKICEHVCAVTL